MTSGVFELDGGRWDVDNNIYLIGDDKEVVIVDAAHEAGPIIDAVGARDVVAVVCTHGHNDHITVAPQLGHRLHAPVLLHPADAMLWKASHPDERYWDLVDDNKIAVAGAEMRVLHTPGHSPGSCCIHLQDLDVLFSGDTLFAGGPGATGRSYSSFPTIIDAIRDRLFVLPEQTVVHTGHGDNTTIGTESPFLAEWIARGS